MIPFLSLPSQLILLGAAVAFVWGHGYYQGYQKLTEYKAEQFAAANELKAKREKVTEKVLIKYLPAAAKTEIVTKVIEKEVVKYANTGYCLDPEWRRLHDAAARNELPKTAERADDSSEAPKAATALATVTENYGAHNTCVNRLNALQEWVKEQAALH